jgi:hypothetical protein
MELDLGQFVKLYSSRHPTIIGEVVGLDDDGYVSIETSNGKIEYVYAGYYTASNLSELEKQLT